MTDLKRPYDSRRWRKLRGQVLELAGFKCSRCPTAWGLHIHHKIKWTEKPELAFELSNLEVLCEYCHQKEHQTKAGQRCQDWNDQVNDLVNNLATNGG